MPSGHSDFFSGIRDVLPFLPGFFPFGIITGVTALNAGMTTIEAVFMSVIMFAGAAQLAAIDLLTRDASAWVVIFAALLVNVRFMMFSASIAPYLRSLPIRSKLVGGFLLSTPSYVLSITEFEREQPPNRRWYYFGASLPVWVNWQVATVTGVLLGARVPSGLQLDFVIPLVFMTLLFTALDDRASQVAGLGGGVIAVAGAQLPLNLGLLVGVAGGIVAGLIAERGGAMHGGS